MVRPRKTPTNMSPVVFMPSSCLSQFDLLARAVANRLEYLRLSD
jgi:hypothetical protein